MIKWKIGKTLKEKGVPIMGVVVGAVAPYAGVFGFWDDVTTF